MVRSCLLAATLVASLAVPSTAAETICFNQQFPVLPTNWTGLAEIPCFHPKLGVLSSISIQADYTLHAAVRVESTDPAATVVASSLQTAFVLQHPDSTTLAFSGPIANFNDSLTAFDGTLDFGGTSGVQHVDLVALGNQSVTLATSYDRALFTGDGSIAVPVSVFVNSFVAASGNVATELTSVVSVRVQVCYTYETDDDAKKLIGSVVSTKRGDALVIGDALGASPITAPRRRLGQLRRSIGTYGRSVEPV